MSYLHLFFHFQTSQKDSLSFLIFPSSAHDLTFKVGLYPTTLLKVPCDSISMDFLFQNPNPLFPLLFSLAEAAHSGFHPGPLVAPVLVSALPPCPQIDLPRCSEFDTPPHLYAPAAASLSFTASAIL